MEYVRAEITGNTVLLMKFAKLHAIFFFFWLDNTTVKVQF